MITTKITVLCLLLFQCHSFHMISDFSIKNMIIAQNNITYCEIYDYMRNESIKTFSDYYELDDFKISNYAEQIKQHHIEVILDYTIFYHNIEKNPDNVAYIQKAKEQNDSSYQSLYQEYLEQKEMNMQIKIIIDENHHFSMYTYNSPHGEGDWRPFEMDDCIIK